MKYFSVKSNGPGWHVEDEKIILARFEGTKAKENSAEYAKFLQDKFDATQTRMFPISFKDDLIKENTEKAMKEKSAVQTPGGQTTDLNRFSIKFVNSKAEEIKELKSMLNRRSLENGSDTPDFILAEFMMEALELLEKTINKRRKWHTGEAL